MFVGTYTPRLDDKGRLIFPAKFRERLKAGLVITKGQERCLIVYPIDEFNRVRTQLPTGPKLSKEERDYNRFFLAAASDEMPDKQGRITIPPALRSYAALKRDVAVLGQGDLIEVWDAEAWRSYEETQEQSYSDAGDGEVSM